MSPSMRAAVIVVNYGSSDLLQRNLAPLSVDAGELTVVVVDNRTTDQERKQVRELAAKHGWLLVEPPANLGFGGAMNRGVRVAHEHGADVTVLLNPDAWIDAADLRGLAAAALDAPLALVAPRIDRPDGSPWFSGADLNLRDGRIRWSQGRIPDAATEPWLTGACLAVSRSLWERVGGFDERYFLYWEDVDLSWRVRRAGGRLVLRDDLHAVHDQGGTQRSMTAGRDTAPKSSVYYYYNIRNRLLFAASHLPPKQVRRWRRTAVIVGWEVLMQGGRRQLLASPAPLVAMVRGLLDGRRLSASAAKRRAVRARTQRD